MTCEYVFALLSYWASAHPSFSGYDDDYDDALLDDHLMLWDSIQSSRDGIAVRTIRSCGDR